MEDSRRSHGPPVFCWFFPILLRTKLGANLAKLTLSAETMGASGKWSAHCAAPPRSVLGARGGPADLGPRQARGPGRGEGRRGWRGWVSRSTRERHTRGGMARVRRALPIRPRSRPGRENGALALRTAAQTGAAWAAGAAAAGKRKASTCSSLGHKGQFCTS